MLVTLVPIVTLDSLPQSKNASAPMMVTLLGIVTLVRLYSFERPGPDAGDVGANRDAVQARTADKRLRPRCW